MKEKINRNIFSAPDFNNLPEVFETIVESKHFIIERIVTDGAISMPGDWYDQDQDEWVILLQGEAIIEFENGNKESLYKGKYLIIKAHCRHRIIKTSADPNCIWLAVHKK